MTHLCKSTIISSVHEAGNVQVPEQYPEMPLFGDLPPLAYSDIFILGQRHDGFLFSTMTFLQCVMTPSRQPKAIPYQNDVLPTLQS